MKTRLKQNSIRSESGFIVADFLFAFVMTLGVGIFIFALTFSLATIEVGQYIVWSTARNYSAANQGQVQAAAAAREKFTALAEQFPLLTNIGGESSWFELSADDLKIGDDLTTSDTALGISGQDAVNDYRQPWTGASTVIKLKLFSGLTIPFLGKVVADGSMLEFPIRAFLIRNVSQQECEAFFNGLNSGPRISQGIKKLDNEKLAKETWALEGESGSGITHGEDNGC
jgi:hypothetical protein